MPPVHVWRRPLPRFKKGKEELWETKESSLNSLDDDLVMLNYLNKAQIT